MHVDLIIRNGHIVDPVNKVDMKGDLVLTDGVIAAVSEGAHIGEAKEIIDAEGLLVVPGVVDAHVHLVRMSSGGSPYNMLLRRGVTTALDMRGDIDTFVNEMSVQGHGLHAACLHALVIGQDLRSNDADVQEVSDAIDKVLEQGAFGIKIMGGHYPYTPRTTQLIMEECAKRKVYVAIHAGTTEHGSNINGLEQSVTLAQGRPLHLAHVNAYCRGQVESSLLEAHRALACLEANPNVVSESYISMMNGTSTAVDASGIPSSAVTRTCLQRRGYKADRQGMGQAIREGWARIFAKCGSEMTYLPPAQGYEYWEAADTNAHCSFAVNDPVAMLACLLGRRKDGSFTVDAVSTDGGGIPRNVIFENGIRIVQMGYMPLHDLVLKSSYQPARMLGLHSKGHFTPGADGDVAIFDPATGQARYTIAGGHVRMAGGVCGQGSGIVVSSPQGAASLKKREIPSLVPNLASSTFLQGHLA